MLDDIKKTLWATADKLRANMDAAEYKHLVLGLIFVKFISDTFAARRAELRPRLLDPADDYFYGQASAEDIEAELEDRDYYREVNVFWVPEPARWEALRAAAKQPDIGKRIDDALSLIEAENPKLKGILDKRFARAQLPDGKLGELVDLVSTIGFGSSAAEARDVLGQVYEYFLGMFASAEGKRGGSVMLRLPDRLAAAEVVAILRRDGITTDHRGQTLRLSPGNLTTTEGVVRLTEALSRLLGT